MRNYRKPIILAVDDKAEELTGIEEMLSDRYDIICVRDAISALRVIDRRPPRLFILDIEMPLMNGFELAQQLRKDKRYERTPIIFLTGRNTREDVMAAITTGGNEYLLKPVEKKLLISKIMQHLETKKF